MPLALDPEKATQLKEKAQHLWEIVRNLSVKQRTVFVLRFLQDMSVADIAEVTNIKPGTVKTHLARAVKQIRERGGS